MYLLLLDYDCKFSGQYVCGLEAKIKSYAMLTTWETLNGAVAFLLIHNHCRAMSFSDVMSVMAMSLNNPKQEDCQGSTRGGSL